ncbi:MAG TPA: hypothetical protein VMT00_03095 [Thermoanaerobaculia bacterium]|nr:hypothetical protein [Thermoanaerobaculia bacterium]
MRLEHPAVRSPLFELVRAVEVDIQLGSDFWTVRIELLRDLERSDRFRCRFWESEMFRLQPTFPQDEAHQPVESSDEIVQVERPIPHQPIDAKDFVASSPDDALQMMIASLEQFLEYTTGEKSS